MFNPMFTGYPSAGQQMPQQPAFMQSSMPIPQSQITPAVPSPAFLQVGTAKEFDNVTIQPGRQALIMAQNDPYLAFKTADAMGMVTTTYYRLEQISSDQINKPSSEYITREEFNQVIQQLINNTKPQTKSKKEASE